MKIYIRRSDLSSDEYDQPFVLATRHPGVGEVTLATLRYGCTEAKEMVDLEKFGRALVRAFNDYPALHYGRDRVPVCGVHSVNVIEDKRAFSAAIHEGTACEACVKVYNLTPGSRGKVHLYDTHYEPLCGCPLTPNMILVSHYGDTAPKNRCKKCDSKVVPA